MSEYDIEPKIGDHLVTDRILYKHHGIYVGDGLVIHYSGLSKGFSSGPVSEVSLEEFSGGRGFDIRAHKDRKYSGPESASRARGRLGESRYGVYGNNCEHFVEWCITGESKSRQVRVVNKSALTLGGKMIAERAVKAVTGGAGVSSVVVSGAGRLASKVVPILGAVSIGYGAYRLYRKMKAKETEGAEEDPQA